jgi:NhaA family Na+:H+ antiporter
MHEEHRLDRGPVWLRVAFDYSAFLILGTIAALLWANLDPSTPEREGSYERFVHTAIPLPAAAEDVLFGPASHEQEVDGHADEGHVAAKDAVSAEPHHSRLTIHFLINDLLMAFFFAIAAKEVLEAFLPGGDLSNRRKAATPLLATLGGLIGPAAVYLAIAALAGDLETHWSGWAIPTATDIAFSYLAAKLIFGGSHPAIAFLLLLAIADDAAGLVIIAVFYPQQPIEPWWFLLSAGSCALAFAFARMRVLSHWWYLAIPGTLCWWSFVRAGVHPALGLVPIVAFLPHAHTDLGIFAREELNRRDTLSAFEAFWKTPVEIFLGLFGLANAGVVLSSFGSGTWMVLLGLLIGKPVGITLFTWLAMRIGLQKPAGMTMRHVVVIGVIAAMGFTVALFMSSSAFPGSGTQETILEQAKMGALLSFGAAFLAFGVARALGIRPMQETAGVSGDAPPDHERTTPG